MTAGLASALLLAAAAADPEPVDSDSDRPEGRALAIGLDPGAAQDALDFAKFAEDTLGMSEEHVKLLTGADATAVAIMGALDELLSPTLTGPRGSLWLYFAGPVRDDGRFLGSDLRPTTPSLQDIFRRMATSRAAERVVLLDAVPSGHPLPKAPPGVVLLAGAAGEGRKATVAGRGAFTRQLLFGLRGAADADGDGDVSFGELGAYVRRKLTSEGGAPVVQLGGRGESLAVESPDPDDDDHFSAPPIVLLRDTPDAVQSGRLYVEASFPGPITLDGRYTGQSTPATLADLPIGRHRVEVYSAEGHGAAIADVLPGGLAAVYVEIGKRPRAPLVRIETLPAEAFLSVDGKSALHAPITVPLASGDHTLHAESSGFQTVDQTLHVDESTEQEVVKLKPADGSYVLSVLSPLVEYDVRYRGDLWYGGRLHALLAGYDLGTGAWNALYAGFAAMAHYRFEDTASSAIGLDFYGGPSIEYAQYDPNGGGFARTDTMLGAIAGVALRLGFFQLMFEAHGGVVGGEVHLIVSPTLAFRYDR